MDHILKYAHLPKICISMLQASKRLVIANVHSKTKLCPYTCLRLFVHFLPLLRGPYCYCVVALLRLANCIVGFRNVKWMGIFAIVVHIVIVKNLTANLGVL